MKDQLKSLITQYFSMKDIRRVFSFVLPYILKRWKAYIAILLLLGLDIYLTIAFAKFYGEITDTAIHGGYKQILSFIPYGALLILISIASSVSYTFFNMIATNGVKMDLKNHFFNHILRLPSGEVSNYRSGELMSHFSNDIHGVDGVIGSSLISLVRLPIIYIVVFVYLVNINLTLCLVSLVIAPIAALSGLVFGLLLRKNGRLIHRLVGNINSLLSETFHGLMVIRSFTLEKLHYKKYVNQNQELYQLELENAKLQSWYKTGEQIIGSITFIINLSIGALFVSKGELTVGALLTFLNLVTHLFYPITGMANVWAGFQRSVAALERVLDVLEKPADVKELPSFTQNSRVNGNIEYRNVTFSYVENKKVFEHFNLEIPKGKVVALVGPSGAGKSTLFNLLQGFYKPQSGDILIGGKSLQELSASDLRSSIALVPQETFLFSGTVKENLFIARPNITEKEMVEAAIRAEIHDFILSLPKGYDTEIGENGIKLSGGQKQRIAIARAILKDAPILLLDEATSALDGETEYYVKEALEELMQGRTTIIIAHRLTTIQHSDIIMVMDQGEIVQQGTHNELMKQIGLYRKLYDSSFSSKSESNLPLVAK
ncbi:ATP-binding cassette subfamily B protein/subfamily B ATP-binding cassette protein MsbA [Neobacillus bataviensis]|uniref:ATP-binding cassette subfamily B protein/subfamily B ATP-binding cassette protein MsbA n=1 Tax=Neobacillus bataviensis TaxID=220685 RepID=A0A561D623_9BACI|nr:ABC transporter ATP-binding protein [Neobacillus bataviensis]TWD98885.1 ATP-binding cassette subfamily B protein/subfamily B ATP-binding cassette protein MsbA [Neobacillus bataviensis]